MSQLIKLKKFIIYIYVMYLLFKNILNKDHQLKYQLKLFQIQIYLSQKSTIFRLTVNTNKLLAFYLKLLQLLKFFNFYLNKQNLFYLIQ